MKGKVDSFSLVDKGYYVQPLVTIAVSKEDYDKIAHLTICNHYNLDVEINTISPFGEVVEKMKKAWDMIWNKKESDMQVIFNEPATILYKDGKKYVSKCDKEDKFSEELGLALCLLKSFGVSYSDFEKLLKGAKRQGGENGKGN